MTRVLLVGYDPEAVDFSNPALPPGMSVEKVRAGVALALKQMKERGWEGLSARRLSPPPILWTAGVDVLSFNAAELPELLRRTAVRANSDVRFRG